MELITIFVLLLAGFMVIGIVAAISYNHQNHNDAEPESDDLPRIVVSQQVPSVSDLFSRTDNHKK